MDKRTISLNDSNSDWVQTQGGGDADAYVNDVIARDRQRTEAEAELREMLEKARSSGLSQRTPQQIIADIKAEMKADGSL